MVPISWRAAPVSRGDGGTSRLGRRFMEDNGGTYSVEGVTYESEGGIYHLMSSISNIRPVGTYELVGGTHQPE